eukprot:CAMPEP_0177635526 /NCGR_PEP_ID=MMETSP0447-20121125/3951_1 /TAXON_ID=0 /ORGANISM="Stygamoeba regulata, Strain BSH-02190019" /LENGTH=88 /DNA_ID=CAMNT_0019137325 /DNA_START=313 /DNA_END=579 /DNA_ORIENTATION=+
MAARQLLVQLLTKPDCCLCHPVKYSVQTQVPFALEVVDISASPTLYDRYKHDIPIVLLNGQEIFRHKFVEKKFKEHLAAAAGGADRTE